MMGHGMIGEFDVYGVYFPAFAVFAAIAFVLQLVIKRLLDACGVYVLSGIARCLIWRSM